MTPISFKSTIVVVFSVLFSLARSVRIKDRYTEPIIKTATIEGTRHPVHILLTQNGISCANIVSKFADSYSHTKLKDPSLCKAGAKLATDMKMKVKAALENATHELPPPDAVLSSVLMRGIETAILQYDPFPEPVFVVPWLRQKRKGFKDNQWNDRAEQVEILKSKYPQGWKLDYQYVDNLGYDRKEVWENFLHFLSKSFLPDLIYSKGKSDLEPIVLAVVAHNNIMSEGVVHDACKAHYKTDTKANNYQVVKLSYFFSSLANGTSIDITPERTLTPFRKASGDLPDCASVVDGVSLYTEEGKLQRLCKSDVGTDCMAKIRETGGKFPTFVEDELKRKSGVLWKLAAELGEEANFDKQEKLKTEVTAISGEINSLQYKDCWSGEKPESVVG